MGSLLHPPLVLPASLISGSESLVQFSLARDSNIIFKAQCKTEMQGLLFRNSYLFQYINHRALGAFQVWEPVQLYRLDAHEVSPGPASFTQIFGMTWLFTTHSPCVCASHLPAVN